MNDSGISLLRLHGDCHPGNILWTPTSAAATAGPGPHFVDLDDARTGPAVQDFWMLLSGDRSQRTRQLGALVDGYEQFRDFNRAELVLIEPLRTLRLIHYSAWLARRWEDPTFPVNFPWFGEALSPGSMELAKQCASINDGAVVCSKEALAWTLRTIGWPQIGNLIGLAAGLALPSVILMMMFGQTRIFFVMSRDGLLPEVFSRVHPRFHTPHVITILTGIFVALFAAFFPVGKLADISNSGTLFAFAAVSIAVLMLRRTDPARRRPFRTPAIGITAPLAIIGCVYLFVSLGYETKMMFLGWAMLGLVVYFLYSRQRSFVGRGFIDVHEDDSDVPPQPVPPLPGVHTPGGSDA